MTDREQINNIIEMVRANNHLDQYDQLDDTTHLRNDLGFDSLALAELTVRLEEKFGVDIFADGPVETIKNVIQKIDKTLS